MARRVLQRAAPRRKRVWARDANNDVIVGTAPFARDLLSTFSLEYSANILGATVGRCRGTVSLARTSGASIQPHAVFGLLVAPATVEAVDIGPFLNPHLDWMYWSKRYLNDAAGGQAVASLGTMAWDVDIRAMRKMEELGETLWFVAESSLTDNFAISWGWSTMLILP